LSFLIILSGHPCPLPRWKTELTILVNPLGFPKPFKLNTHHTFTTGIFSSAVPGGIGGWSPNGFDHHISLTRMVRRDDLLGDGGPRKVEDFLGYNGQGCPSRMM